MKTFYKFIIFSTLCFSSTYSFSQDYIKFPEEGAAWVVEYSYCGEMPCQFNYRHFEYAGDTVFDGKKYNIITKDLVWDKFVYDSNKVVYVYDPEINSTLEIYNFNLNIKDTFIYSNSIDTINLAVYDRDSVQIDDRYHTRLKLYTEHPDVFDTLVWIEGIGSTFGPLYYDYFPFFETFTILNCYKHNENNLFGTCITFDAPTYQKIQKQILIHPNPICDESFLDSPFSGSSIIKIYDSSGKLMVNQEIGQQYSIKKRDFKKGIYFIVLSNEECAYTSKFIIY